jgi:hypothetical protein
LHLLGFDAENATTDGVSIGKSFMDGFLDGFDGKKVSEALKNAIGGIVQDAGTLLPGGKDSSSTAWLSALLVGGVALKGGKGIASLAKGGKSFAKAFTGSSKVGSEVAETVSKSLASAGESVGKSAGKALTESGAGVSKSLISAGESAGKAIGALNIVGDIASWGMSISNVIQAEEKDRTKVIATEIGGQLGGYAGMAIGGAIGSVIAPGIGTAIGSAVGGLVGTLGGEVVGGVVDYVAQHNAGMKSAVNGMNTGISAIMAGEPKTFTDAERAAIDTGALDYENQLQASKNASIWASADSAKQITAQEKFEKEQAEYLEKQQELAEQQKTKDWQSKLATDISNGAYLTPHANGGIMTTPHLGLVAEDGAEAIIPLSGSKRNTGFKLWEKAGEMLGVTPYSGGAILGNSPAPKIGNGCNISVSAPNVKLEVNVNGAQNSDDIVQIIKDNVQNITDDIAYNLAKSLNQVFANMPLVAEGV